METPPHKDRHGNGERPSLPWRLVMLLAARLAFEE